MLSREQPLAGLRALVTGASRGIGFAIARELAAQGAEIVLAARHDGPLAEAASQLASTGAAVHVHRLDVTDLDAIRRAYDEIEEKIGPIDISVNNAGSFFSGRAIDTPVQIWESAALVNVTSVLTSCQEAAVRMSSRGYGRIINIASVAGMRGVSSAAAYAMSKAAVISLTRCLAVELARTGVTVNAVAPGMFITDMTDEFRDGGKREKWASDLAPIGRFGNVEELAPVVAMFALPSSSFTTGQVIAVDGGWSAT